MVVDAVDRIPEERALIFPIDPEFNCKYRMTRERLGIVTNIIDGHKVFKKAKKGPCQMEMKHPLIVFFQCIGKEDESNDSQRIFDFLR